MQKQYKDFEQKIVDAMLECENIVLAEDTPLEDQVIYSSIAFVLLRIKEDPAGVKQKVWSEIKNSTGS